MTRLHTHALSALTAVALFGLPASAASPPPVPLDWQASLTANAASGTFAPFYQASNNYGTLTQPESTLARIKASRDFDRNRRFSWAFGADFIAGYTSGVKYDRYNAADKSWDAIRRHPSRGWIQQLYASVKWRSLFMTVGNRETGSALLNDRLSSGDYTWSPNARPVVGVRVGLIDFQPIPFTKGWVEVQTEFYAGRPHDNGWLTDHFNFYNSFITVRRWVNYKRMYFRTNPSRPFSVTVGMQTGAQFGGTKAFYYGGQLIQITKDPFNLRQFLKMIVPQSDGSYWAGNHLGSWDMVARYKLHSGHTLKAYFQWPWDDGSGIGKLNGFDGLWGMEYRAPERCWLTGAVIEYLDFTNQSGPLHWAPSDRPGTTIPSQATGSDAYYNNYYYNGWALYGMGQGNPMFTSPFYNTDGYLRFVDNILRGFHIGLEGALASRLDYRALFSYRQVWGDGYVLRTNKAHDTSMMIELTWSSKTTPGLSICGSIAADFGDIYGNSVGAAVTISYSGSFKLFSK